MTYVEWNPLRTSARTVLICPWPEPPGRQGAEVCNVLARLKSLAVVGIDDGRQPTTLIRLGAQADAARPHDLTADAPTPTPRRWLAARVRARNRVELDANWPRSIAADANLHGCGASPQ